MKKFLSVLILQICLFTFCSAQFPHVSGTIKISLKNGMIEGDLEISDLPKINVYSILLNTGLNVRYFRDSSDSFNYYFERYYNDEQSYEAFQYYFPGNDKKTRFLPKKFRINYVGAFPVISDTLKASNGGDWKGNIAFNGSYLRATEQSAWYPILYDTLNDVIYDQVTYDLKVICEDGESIYINGCPPAKGPSADLSSRSAVSLMLFAGNYDFNKKDKTWFVNTSLNDKQQTVLSSWSNKIINFYEGKLKIPYGSPVTFLGAAPVSKKQSWMFVTYPTIAVVGHPPYDIKSYFNEKTQELKDSSGIKYYSHELGHYYFGTYFVANSDLKWLFLEGMTEYLSLQTSREILGESYYKKSISRYIEEIKDFQPVHLNLVKEESDIDEIYRYDYAPLLLTALEKQIGKERMWKWLDIILMSKNAKTNYDFFKSTLLQSGVSQKEFTDFENMYIKSTDAKQNVIDKMK